MDARIVKLVFIRVEGIEGARKAVVPLVVGCDFDGFLVRVRRRLQLPDDASISISDPASGAIDSIDRLLEAEEGNTLDVHVPQGYIPYTASTPRPSPAVPTPSAAESSAGTPSRGPMHRSSLGAGPSAPMAEASGVPECRMDVAASPGGETYDDNESGAGKYRKRNDSGRTRRIVIALLLLGAVVVGVHQFMGS